LKQSHVTCNIHGHTHPGRGQSSVVAVPVVNPGSLKEGNFGIITLRVDSGKWRLQSAQFIHLPSVNYKL